MTFTPTPEQSAIVDFLSTSEDNLLINALAGAAKTSTLTLAAHTVTVPTLSIAFNKRIAEELAERMPPHVECRTLNSIGHRALGRFLRKRLTLKTSKRGDILREEIKALPSSDQGPAWDAYSDMMRAIETGVNNGYLPDRAFPQVRPLMDDAGLWESLEWNPSELEMDLIRATSRKAVTLALQGVIDFADQLLIPTLWPTSFDSYPLVYIDEAQDLSALNHAMLKKIVRRNRIVAVGDPLQSIYAFRGASTGAMRHLRETFSMQTLPLTISFRCPRAVVRHVHWHAPEMRWPEWAKEGEVRVLTKWGPEDIPEGAAIICRNNAPLMRTALRLLRAGRRPLVLGNDILRGLLKDLKRLGDPEQDREASLRALEALRLTLEARYRSAAFIADKIECLRVFIDATPNLGQAITRAEHVFKMQGSITLCTGHKSKGLEFNDVFFLDEHLVRGGPGEGDPQEQNLRYVIATRAKERLTYITTEGWDEGEEE